MKIIKQGKTEKELKAILNKTKRFECKTCGCIFEADKGEYVEEEHGTTYCVCPNCSRNAFEVKMCETCRYYNNNTYWCSRYNDTTYSSNCSSYQVKEG